jgi:hypothetical protein
MSKQQKSSKSLDYWKERCKTSLLIKVMRNKKKANGHVTVE